MEVDALSAGIVNGMEIGLGWKNYEPNVDIVDSAVEAEDVGFDWVGLPETRLDPVPFLAAIASRTERIKLATTVSIAFASNPMSMAMMARSMQAISNERFEMGLGSQVRASVTKRYSSQWSSPAARMGEFIAAFNHIWDHWETGERLNFRGQFYRHTYSLPIYTPPPGLARPKVGVATVGERMTEEVAAHGDFCFAHLMASEQYLTSHVLPAMSAGAARRNDGVKPSLIRWLGVLTAEKDEDLHDAIEEARVDLATWIATPNYLGMLEAVGLGDLQSKVSDLALYREYDKMAGLISDEILHTFYSIGSPGELPDQVADRVTDPSVRVLLAINQSASPKDLAPTLARLRQTS